MMKTGRRQRDFGFANTDGKNFQDSLLEECRRMTQSAVHTHGSNTGNSRAIGPRTADGPRG